MAAPVRNGVELDAVGEPHLVLFVEPTTFFASLGLLEEFFGLSLFPGLNIGVIYQLVLLRAVPWSALMRCSPSPVQRA